MLTIKPPPPLEDTRLTTLWIGDPAIDVEDSDIDRWCETGDPDYLTARPGEKASAITYRRLSELELGALPSGGGQGGFERRMIAAACYGLVSIDGLKLQHEIKDELYRVAFTQLASFHEEWRATIPLWRPGNVMFQVERGVDLVDPSKGREEESSLPVWLGVQILARSFRFRGRCARAANIAVP